jgi:hypothetical protein
MLPVPDTRITPAWAETVRLHAQGRPILCLPFAQGHSEQGLEAAARWMLLQSHHRLPLVNGYSGFFPESWYEHEALFTADQWNAVALQRMASLGVCAVVIDTSRPGGPRCHGSGREGDSYRVSGYLFKRLIADDRGIEVWSFESTAVHD